MGEVSRLRLAELSLRLGLVHSAVLTLPAWIRTPALALFLAIAPVKREKTTLTRPSGPRIPCGCNAAGGSLQWRLARAEQTQAVKVL